MSENGPETIPYRVRTLEREIALLKQTAAEALLVRQRLEANVEETRGVKRALWGVGAAVLIGAISNFFK